jgi:hypothetical protein
MLRQSCCELTPPDRDSLFRALQSVGFDSKKNKQSLFHTFGSTFLLIEKTRNNNKELHIPYQLKTESLGGQVMDKVFTQFSTVLFFFTILFYKHISKIQSTIEKY